MRAKNAVVNTSSESHRDPLATFVKVVLPASASGGIEAMERAGQEQFLASDILPTDITDPLYTRVGGRALLESWGFTFGKPVGGDTIFTQAKLPTEWVKQGSDHDMWSYILDNLGRRRCAIFYKAAFYDRSAHLQISSRYTCDVEEETGKARGIVKDGATQLFVGEWRAQPTEGTDYEREYGARALAQKDAREWLKANLPEDVAEQWARP